jgi:hypothetical protein
LRYECHGDVHLAVLLIIPMRGTRLVKCPS